MARKEVKDYAVFKNVDDTASINLYYTSGGADTITNLSLAEGDFIVSLLRNEKPMSYDHDRGRLSTLRPEPVGEGEGGPTSPFFTLDNWLNNRHQIRDSINWEFPGGTLKNYRNWTGAQKRELEDNYKRVLRNQTLNLPEAPPLAFTPSGTETAVTYLSSDWAWKYYIGYIAHSLVVEGDVRVSWSLGSLSNEEKTEILDGRSFFIRRSDDTYDIRRTVFGGVTYGNPSRLYQFLRSNDLIGSTHLETIVRIVGWCRNLIHYSGGHEADNVFDQWQYYGLPPVERVINGTPRNSQPGGGVHKRTGGCWGTTGLLRTLLRIINIPAKLVIGGGHAIPHFMSVDKYLSHGDDPYNQLFKSADDIPVIELLIGASTFNSWFVSSSNPTDNVGRQNRELALQYLPPYLLRKHCDDLAAGRGHTSSEVAEIFDRNYTVAQLEAMNLWTRMDAKIASLGGCGAI